jgi:L-asparaginase II
VGKPIRVIGTRGKVVETEHDIVYAVVRDEKVIDSGGDINLNRAMRSSAKLIQAIVCIETGAADAFKLTTAELAVIASSHNGNDLHVRTIRRILRKCGVPESRLQCGLQGGIIRQTHEELLRQGRKIKRIHHNCSGKHAGILASCKHMGWPLDTYRSPKHPWNRRVFELISLFTDIPAKKVSHAIDGCGVPVIFTPVKESAVAYARYSTPDMLPGPVARAARRIAAAVNRHPYHNSGRTRFLAALYKAAPGKFVAKEGGQGVFCLGVLGKKMGLAVKILDGRNYSYNPYEPALIHLMKRHGLLNRSELGKLRQYQQPDITNSRNEVVGKLKVVE